MLVGLLTGLRCSLKQFLRRRFVSPIGSSGMGDFCKTKSFGRFMSRVAVLYNLGTLTSRRREGCKTQPEVNF